MPWYDKKWVIWLFVIILWPVGLIMMWRSPSFGIKTKGIVTAVFALLMFLPHNAPSSSKTTPSASTTKTEQSAPENKPSPPKVHYNGRGYDGRSEPDYVGLNGFVAVWRDEEKELLTDLNYTFTPWQVPTYERDKQFWIKSDATIEHKTPIIVREQFLKHEGYDNYSGYLRVETQDGRQVFINVRNFVVKPYWTNKNVADALQGGLVIVTFHQRSDFYPVNVNNRAVRRFESSSRQQKNEQSRDCPIFYFYEY